MLCAISTAQNGLGKQCQGTKGSAYLFSPFFRRLCVHLFRDLNEMHGFSHMSTCFVAVFQGNPLLFIFISCPITMTPPETERCCQEGVTMTCGGVSVVPVRELFHFVKRKVAGEVACFSAARFSQQSR